MRADPGAGRTGRLHRDARPRRPGWRRAYRAALLDWMACAASGASERAARAAAAAGDGLLERVAWLGTAGHVLDFDDTYLPGIAHLSAPIAPAAIAVGAARRGDRGRRPRRLRARLRGDGRARRARATRRSMTAAGTRPRCAAASARRSRQGAARRPRRTAAALAALRAGGLRAAFGSDGKAMQVGMAAASGVDAALAAEAGADVPRDASPPVVREAFGGEWAEPDDGPPAIAANWIKPWPCCLRRTARSSARSAGAAPAGPARRARPPGLAPGRRLRRRRDAAAGEVLDPLHVAFTLLHGGPRATLRRARPRGAGASPRG